jgi:hypothetical protein
LTLFSFATCTPFQQKQPHEIRQSARNGIVTGASSRDQNGKKTRLTITMRKLTCSQAMFSYAERSGIWRQTTQISGICICVQWKHSSRMMRPIRTHTLELRVGRRLLLLAGTLLIKYSRHTRQTVYDMGERARTRLQDWNRRILSALQRAIPRLAPSLPLPLRSTKSPSKSYSILTQHRKHWQNTYGILHQMRPPTRANATSPPQTSSAFHTGTGLKAPKRALFPLF